MKGFPEGEEIFRYIHNSGALATQAAPPQQPRPGHVGYGPRRAAGRPAAVQRHTLRRPDSSGGSGLRGTRQHPHRRPQQAQVMGVAGRPGRGSRGGGGKLIRGGARLRRHEASSETKQRVFPYSCTMPGLRRDSSGWAGAKGSARYSCSLWWLRPACITRGAEMLQVADTGW